MIGPKFLNVGMRGFMALLAHDDRPVPPPILIVRDETEMVRALQAEYAAVARQDKTCCIVLVKPDAIEEGAEAGVVAAVGDQFSRGLRPYDGLFAFGQDRYLIALPHIKPEDTLPVMNRLRGSIAGKLVHLGGSEATRATVSMGGTMIDAALPMQVSIDRASQALNLARAGGGNQVCLWSPDLDEA